MTSVEKQVVGNELYYWHCFVREKCEKIVRRYQVHTPMIPAGRSLRQLLKTISLAWELEIEKIEIINYLAA